jgi:hypothetical protein
VPLRWILGFVLNVGLNDLSRPAQETAAEIFNRQFDGDLSAGTTYVPVKSGTPAVAAPNVIRRVIILLAFFIVFPAFFWPTK